MEALRKTLYASALALLLCGCGSDNNVKKGDKFFAIGEYYDAAAEYKKAYSHTKIKDRPKRGERAWKMAECYRRINFSAKAMGAYQNAIRYLYPDSSAVLHLAQMQQMQGNYKDAAKTYQAFLDSVPGDPLATSGLQGCIQAQIWKSRPTNYTVKKEPLFNSRRTDFSPVLFGDDWDQLFLTTTRPQATGDDVSGITGTKFADIFVARKDDKDKWGQPELVESEVNSEYDDGVCCFSADEKTMYFTRCTFDPDYPRYAEIYTSQRSDASWSKPQKLDISADTLSSYAHPAVSPDGDWLYFVSDMPGGVGGLDIWRMAIGEHGVGEIENLGEPINTVGDEMFPTFRPNGDLYFSSDGHPGMGGLDLFCATQDSLGVWTVENLKYPMNSSGDDFGMTFEGVHNRGYFSSSRGDARGWDHIFSFECPEVIQTVKGWVYEKDGYELPEGVVYMVGNDGTNLKLSVRGDGSFEQEIQPNVDYVFLGTCKGYLNHKESLRIDTSSVSNQYVLQFPLASITAPVLIRNVFYEFDRADITPSSSLALDSLIDLLNENPNVTIELSSHCDYRGSDEYNERLSQRRAESVVRYLIAGGINPDRLTPVGYGESRPKVVTRKINEQYPFLQIDDTLTEEFIRALPDDSLQEICNALNRRTEFRVLRTTYGLIEELPALKAEELDAILRNNAEIELTNGLDAKEAQAQDSLMLAKDSVQAEPKDSIESQADSLQALPKDSVSVEPVPPAEAQATKEDGSPIPPLGEDEGDPDEQGLTPEGNKEEQP
ncbi:MAG: OmpA family protein [Prevotellaceae bacterium]|nr:OmpA family protein [Prevotellaceae bacterium]